MLEKLKSSKGKIIGHFSAVLVGIVFAGIVASSFSEKLGYSAFALYGFCLFGHSKVSKFIESKIK